MNRCILAIAICGALTGCANSQVQIEHLYVQTIAGQGCKVARGGEASRNVEGAGTGSADVLTQTGQGQAQGLGALSSVFTSMAECQPVP